MEATNLAKGGVYGNFESKDEICLEAFNYLSSSLSAKIDQAVAAEKSAKDKLFALLDFYNKRLANNSTGGCPILNFGVEADDTNPVIKQRVKGAIAVSQKRIANIVKLGIETGEFKAEFNPEAFAIKMFTIIEGATLISRIQNSNTQMEMVTDMLRVEIKQNTI